MVVERKCERVLVVDSHPIVREGIEVVLAKAYAGIDVGGAADMAEASDRCSRDRPDLVLMDVMLPGDDPLPAMGEILRAYPDVRFVVFTALSSEARAADAIRFGAAGYLLKWCSPDGILQAVRRVMAGRVHIDQSLDEARVASAAGGGTLVSPVDELTRREKQVLKLIADGMRNREIASLLNISPKTVDCHRQRLMQKLGARNVASVIHWAYQYGYAKACAPAM
ncbi:LuxR C-terminal-related transcriptional regulator [Burkholderia ubonensis]|uniref:LuxR C-terminal-related transcriptional regulator n=1 Tax=Burkholderia ubonensis TaxID=101571 RepID=UPI000B4E249E|nr:response regulator transcription factor [Burkholderia ubonensis]